MSHERPTLVAHYRNKPCISAKVELLTLGAGCFWSANFDSETPK